MPPPPTTTSVDTEIFKYTTALIAEQSRHSMEAILESQRMFTGHKRAFNPTTTEEIQKAKQKLDSLVRLREELLASLEKPLEPKFTGIAESVRFASQLTSFELRDYVYRGHLKQLLAVDLSHIKPNEATKLVRGLKNAIKDDDACLNDSVLKITQAELHFSLLLSQSAPPPVSLERLVSNFRTFCAKAEGGDAWEKFAQKFSNSLSDYISGHIEEIPEAGGNPTTGKKAE